MYQLTRLIHATVIALTLASAIHAEETTIWQIGQFDGSYDEFAMARNYGAYPAAFPDGVTFQAGKDDPAVAWPFIQPGPGDAWAGSGYHPFTIAFDLADEPSGTFRLSVALADTHSTMPPSVEVSINGNSGRTQLPAGGSDGSLLDPSLGKSHTIRLELPASYLRQGGNIITLQPVTGSWLSYDALQLTNDPDAPAVETSIMNLALRPTVFFVRRASGLKQVVMLDAQFSGAMDGQATLNFKGESQPLHVQSGLFGNARTTIEIDEVAEPAPMEVVMTSAGQTKTATCTVRPEKHWKLYIQDSSHVDIGYTDRQERVIELHNDNMSRALDLCRKYPEFKWNTETAWVADNYLAMMPAERRDEFIALAREGRIGCQANYGNILTGLSSNESLIRYLYFAHAMARRHGIPFDIATSSDVPTQVWTLPTVLAGSGIRYFSAGLNLVRADSFNRLFDKSPFYWQGPDGSKVLTWLAPGYGYVTGLGLDSDLLKAQTLINNFLAGYDRENYPYDAVLAYGGFYDNVRITDRFAEIADEWNRTYEYPRLIYCRGPEFFSYIESNFQDSIPTITGDGGVYWEDGAGSSAYESAISRCAKEDLAAAEKMHALASIASGGAYPSGDIDTAWKNAILYDEHTWGAAESRIHPETENAKAQWAYKSRFAEETAQAASSLKSTGIDALASLVKVNEPSVLVFNPNSWDVKGVAVLQQPDGTTESFVADVPAMGFDVYPLSVLEDSPGQPVTSENVMENRYYRLEVDPVSGAVTHLVDKELGRELVDTSAPYGLNQYLYFLGGGETMKDVTHAEGPAEVQLSKEKSPGRQTLILRSSAFNTPSIETEIVLYDDIKRIDFLNTLEKKPTAEYEAGYFAFPFSIQNPMFHVALPNGVVSPNSDMLDGGCMAWYCTQDFVAVSDGNASLVWTAMDSPLVTLSDVNREVESGFYYPELKPFTAGKKWPVALDKGYVFGYLFNNYWFTNYKASQEGTLRFRYSLTSMPAYDATAASRFGQSVRNPLIARVVRPTATDRDLPAAVSLCSVSPENVCVQTLKRAESGDGWIVRLREVGGKSVKATLTLPVCDFDKAWECNLVEDPGTAIKVSGHSVEVDVKANGLATVMLQ